MIIILNYKIQHYALQTIESNRKSVFLYKIPDVCKRIENEPKKKLKL